MECSSQSSPKSLLDLFGVSVTLTSKKGFCMKSKEHSVIVIDPEMLSYLKKSLLRNEFCIYHINFKRQSFKEF